MYQMGREPWVKISRARSFVILWILLSVLPSGTVEKTKKHNAKQYTTAKTWKIQKKRFGLKKKLQEALVCCDPLTQGTCSWSKFASNVRWPTLSFSCQKQEFRKWLITNFASASYSFTAEELNRLIVIIFEEYARQRKVEEMPLSWRYINHEARLNLEKDVFGESTWAMGSPEQCTRGLSQLLTLWLGLSSNATPQLHVLNIASGNCSNCIDTSQIMFAQHQRPGMPLMTACCKR